MIWIASLAILFSIRTCCKTSVNLMFVAKASLPPRKITAFPALKHKPAASTVTFGRAS